VRCAAWSADGRWIATGSTDRSLVIWDAETQTPVFSGAGDLCEPDRPMTRAFFDDALIWGATTWRWPETADPAAATADPTPQGQRQWWAERDGQRIGAWSDDVSVHLCAPDCRAIPLERLADLGNTCLDDGRCFWSQNPASETVLALSPAGDRVAVG